MNLRDKTKIVLTVEELAGIIGQAIGFGSLCWKPEPTGAFLPEKGVHYVETAVSEVLKRRGNKFQRKLQTMIGAEK